MIHDTCYELEKENSLESPYIDPSFFVPSDETATDKAVELFYWVDSETAHKGSDYDEWCWRIKVNTFWWTLQSKQSLNGKRFKSLKIFS